MSEKLRATRNIYGTATSAISPHQHLNRSSNKTQNTFFFGKWKWFRGTCAHVPRNHFHQAGTREGEQSHVTSFSDSSLNNPSTLPREPGRAVHQPYHGDYQEQYVPLPGLW